MIIKHGLVIKLRGNVHLRRLLLMAHAFLPFLLIYSNLTAQEYATGETLSKKIDSLITAEEELDFGGTILIERRGEVVFQKNYKITPDVHYSFWIGSLSKQFCAAAILRLYDKKMLFPTDSLTRFFDNIPPEKRNITIHQLLTHSSGLGDHYSADGISNSADALRKIMKRDRSSSHEYSYSSDGYQLLALVVEKVTGRLYEEFLFEEFFIPLEMNETGHSGYRQGEMIDFSFNSKKIKRGNPQSWSVNYGYKGATGVVTSVYDLIKWKSALLGGDVLSEKSQGLLLTRHVPKKQLFYGYGWNLFDSKEGRVMLHSGDDDFILHNATFRHYLDTQVTLIILSGDGYFEKRAKASVLASKIIPLLFQEK